jgi:putative sigma-54 modulation protein
MSPAAYCGELILLRIKIISLQSLNKKECFKVVNKRANRKKYHESKDHVSNKFMNLELTGIHLDITDDIRSYFNKKLHRLEFATSYIIDLLFKLIKEKPGYKIEATINFKWGGSAYIHVTGFEIYESIDKLFDKIELKVKKEKNKVKEH